MMIRKEAVIARYQEDLSWIADLGIEICVYNKGAPLPPEWEPTRLYPLENVGREAHTFFTHLTQAYDDLADETYFLQGAPFVGCQDLLARCAAGIPEGTGFTLLAFQNHLTACKGDGCPHHCGLPVAAAYTGITGRPAPEWFSFGAEGQFAATREQIQRQPRAYYERAFAICQADYAEVYPWLMERLWQSLIVPEM